MAIEEVRYDPVKERFYWARLFFNLELESKGQRGKEGLKSFQRENHYNELGPSDTPNPNDIKPS